MSNKKQSSLDSYFNSQKKDEKIQKKREEKESEDASKEKELAKTGETKEEERKKKNGEKTEREALSVPSSPKSPESILSSAQGLTSANDNSSNAELDLEDSERVTDDDEEEEEEEAISIEGAPVELYPKNTPPSCLLQSIYDGKSGKGLLFLLDERSNRLYGWLDTTGHKPYCLSDLKVEDLKKITPVKNFKKIVGYEIVKKRDLLQDKEVAMTKILVTDPLAVGGGIDSLRDKLPAAWEAKIRYHRNYLYDRGLIPGMYYQIKDGILVPVKPAIDRSIEAQVKELFKDSSEEVKNLIPIYFPLFLSRVPYIKRAAIDIEVYTKSMSRIADPKKALEKIISVAIVGNDGQKKIFLLKRKEVPLDTRPKELAADIDIELFENESDLLQKTFKLMSEYPLIITFNGDNFDLPYLYHRAQRLKFNRNDIPIIVGRDHCMLRNSLHFDAYRFFNQAAIKTYAFGAKYSEVSLDAVSSALLAKGKISFDGNIADLPCYELAWYNYWDSKITLELTTFNNSLTMNLIILLMRLTRMPFEDITRQAVSTWIQNWLFAEHRERDYLIPRPEEIIASRGDSTTSAMIKGKKYKGAIVVNPRPGAHFDVTVLDFASLYPSIIKTWNLSYETVNCPHESCKKTKKMIPDTDHWVCNRNRGLMSILIGFIRDLRISWFKPKSKDKSLDQGIREFYDVIQAALKVVLNASYGVFGAAHFPLYCPPLAEATTAIGRQAITKTIEKCTEMGVTVIYGDTDSVFLKKPTKEQIQELIDWSHETLRIDLDIDKHYRYLALSDRKKNYFGVYPDGKVDIKGLLGKKRNTPPFLKDAFNDIVTILSNVKVEEDFEPAKERIEALVQQCYTKLKNRQFTLEELAFKVQLNKKLEQYVKTTPQHVKAARQLLEQKGKRLGVGDMISFVKTKGAAGVKPVELADISEIAIDKYLAQMESTLAQVLEPIGISFDRIIGIRSLDDFFT